MHRPIGREQIIFDEKREIGEGGLQLGMTAVVQVGSGAEPGILHDREAIAIEEKNRATTQLPVNDGGLLAEAGEGQW